MPTAARGSTKSLDARSRRILVERLHYRATSLIDLQAELHERSLLEDASRVARRPVRPPRRRADPLGLSLLRRRIFG